MRPARRRPTPLVRLALLLAAAVSAAGFSTLVFFLLPLELDVRTDIVGYPTFHDFNIKRYFWAYGFMAVVFPLLTLGLYLFLRRTIAPGSAQPSGLVDLLDRRAPAARGDRVELATSAARIVAVGIALGIEIVIGAGWQDIGGAALAAVATGYALAVACVAALAVAGPLRERGLPSVLAAANAVFAIATVLGLVWISAATKVTVSSTGRVDSYPWFPWWIGALLAAVALLLVLRAVRRASSPEEVGRVERRVLLLLVGPVLVFLFVANLPGAPGDVDSFHEGEQLGAAHLTQLGFFPWRDLIFIHGLMSDVAQPLLGLHVFGDTRWGNLAGEAMLAEPATWVALFLLCAYLFRDNWLFLVATQVAVVTGWVFAVQPRFVLLPFVILLMIALLRRPTWPRAIGFITLLGMQALGSPEGSYVVPAYLGTVVVFDLVHRPGFARTKMCSLASAALGASWLGFLASQHAVDDFFFYYRTFAPSHELTGGLPIALGESQTVAPFGGYMYYVLAAAVPVLLLLLAVWYFAARAPSARSIPVDDWAMGATAIFVGLYYVKFISRADHVYHPFAVALPLLFYAVYRGISAVEMLASSRRPRWVPPRHLVTLPLLAVLLVGAPTGLLKVQEAIPSHFEVFAPREPPVARVGYVLNNEPLFRSVFPGPPESLGPSLVHDLGTIMRAYVRPGERIFDFSNNPGLFWYVLQLEPATRYYHVSMAIRQATQHNLIRELRDEQPRIVVFSSDWLGLPFWDGIANEVRHYDVSRYLLDHYRPLLHSHGFLVLARNGAQVRPVSDITSRLEEPAQTTDLYFRTFACDWGYTPDFLTIHPQSDSGAVTLQAERGVLHVPADLAAHFGWLEVEGSSPFTRTSFELSDRLAANSDGGRTIRFRTRGGTDTVRIQVGSCSQWHGYRSRTLYLRVDPPQPIHAVRLLR